MTASPRSHSTVDRGPSADPRADLQAGYRSRYGHPAPDVLARYAARGIRVERSDRCGAWVWQPGQGELDTPGSQTTCTRAERRRYWHHSWPQPFQPD